MKSNRNFKAFWGHVTLNNEAMTTVGLRPPSSPRVVGSLIHGLDITYKNRGNKA